MEHAREYTISVLKDLLNLCREEHTLFNSAKEKIEDNSIKQTFLKCANEKAGIINKIETEIIRLGGSIEDLEKEIIIEQDLPTDKKLNGEQEKFVHYCLEKDKITLNRYSTAMNEDIMWEVVPLIAKQYFDSKNLHDKILYNCVKNQRPNMLLGNVS